MELTGLQRKMLNFVKDNDFFCTWNQFVESHPVYSREEIEEAARVLRVNHIASGSPGLMDTRVGVTVKGHKLMGWELCPYAANN